MIITENPEGFKNIEIKELQEIIKDERFIFLIGIIFPPRPGVMPFFTKLEYSYFPPGTKKNDEFIAVISNWNDISWIITGIPKGYMGIARKLSKQFELRIIDGIPHKIGEGKVKSFPINGKNVFTLENIRRHEVYGVNSKEYWKKLWIREEKEIDSIIQGKTAKKEQEEEKKVKIIWDED